MNSVLNYGPGRWRVLIDASPVTNAVDGLSVYIVNLIKHLPEESFADIEYTILLNPGVEWPDLAAAISHHGLRELREEIAPIGPRRDRDMYRFLRRRGADFDLIHSSSNNYPLTLKNGVCTIHDVTFKTWFDRKSGIPGTAWLAQLYLSLVIKNALRNAQAIIAVSHSTRQELQRLFGASSDQMAKIEVIHEGWEHLKDYESTGCEASSFEADGYLFYLGSYRVHKNLARLLEAFRQALPHIPRGKKLVISGSAGKLSGKYRDIVAALNADEERLVFTGYVSNARVRRLYEHADAFIFPSLSEGFGLPLLEAFYSGSPVLCSRSTSLPEVAGDAALYFDAENTADIARAIVDFYARPNLAGTLRQAGHQRLEHFSWTKAAAETVALYRRCLKRLGRSAA